MKRSRFTEEQIIAILREIVVCAIGRFARFIFEQMLAYAFEQSSCGGNSTSGINFTARQCLIPSFAYASGVERDHCV